MKIWMSRYKHQIVILIFVHFCLRLSGGFSAGISGEYNNDAISEHDLKKYLQPNDVTNGQYDYLTTEEAEKRRLCSRPCDGATPMICYYIFVVENYNTVGPACGNCTKQADSLDCYKSQCVTGDGVEKPCLTINRQIPGPSIQVCERDLIVADLINKLYDRATTIHWHGLYQQKTPWMDGVPGVTQCSIPPATKFRYKFPAIPDGTFFYHSHQGLQKMDGIVGSFIIRQPRSKDLNTKLYDYDLLSHVILVTDWLHTMMDERLPGNRFYDTGALPDSILANGKTQHFHSNGTGTKAPYSVFKVTAGKRYRFRLIGGTCTTCPVLLTFEKHQLLFIATDGTAAQPVLVDSVLLLAGDRVDCVLAADQPAASYWIQLKGLLQCASKAATYAVLQYDGSKGKTSSSKLPQAMAIPRGKTLNPLDISDCKDKTELCFANLNAALPPPTPAILKPKADKRIILAVDFYLFELKQLFETNTYNRWMQPSPEVLVGSLINNLSYVQTPFPLLTQYSSIPEDQVCSKMANCGKVAPANVCECTHIIKVPFDSIVELIFIDYTKGNDFLIHPLHLHGTDMHVMKQGKIPPNMTAETFLPELIWEMDMEGPTLAKTCPKPIVKDTMGNLGAGYSVMRVHFNNRGMWYFHCHFILHTDTGMSLVFQVGERDKFRKPPRNFPYCDNFHPAVSQNDLKESKNKKQKSGGQSTQKEPNSSDDSPETMRKDPKTTTDEKENSPKNSDSSKSSKDNQTTHKPPTKSDSPNQTSDENPELEKFVEDKYEEILG